MSIDHARNSRMTLDRLMAGLISASDVPPLEINRLCHDSRTLQRGDLFCALAGSRSHGLRHAAEAVAAGAVAILYDPAHDGSDLAQRVSAVPCWPVDFLDQHLGFLADRFYGEPSRHVETIGITGTNGKTSCSHFLAHALSGEKLTGVVGTLGWGLPGGLNATRHTTPDAIEVHAVLDRLRQEGFGAVVMEASSHGLVQGRLNGVRFRGGLFTNLSQDHLDYHIDMTAYLEAKLSLAQWPGLDYFAFNLDDPAATMIQTRIPNATRKIGFSSGSGAATASASCDVVAAEEIEHGSEGIRFLACYQGAGARVKAPVFGDCNVENLLGTLAVLLGRGLSLDEAAARLGNVRPIPGRMERFVTARGAEVVIDYAHTPDALAKTLYGLRRHCQGKLWLVFGCGGERDRGKRPQMGAIAAKWADHVIITDDNPRGEAGDVIVSEILAGCTPSAAEVTVLRDRRLAIQTAIEQAESVDCVLVAGKGHETYQEIDGVKYPFSDRSVVHECLRANQGGPCA